MLGRSTKPITGGCVIPCTSIMSWEDRERIATIKDIEEVDVPDPCDEEAIGASFVDAVEHDKKLEANVEWSVPILPSTAIAERALPLARFSADPEIGAKRMRNSVANIRVSQKGTGGNSYAVSMLEKRTMTKAMRGHISGSKTSAWISKIMLRISLHLSLTGLVPSIYLSDRTLTWLKSMSAKCSP